MEPEVSEGVTTSSVADTTREVFAELSGDSPAPDTTTTETAPPTAAAPLAPQAPVDEPVVSPDPAAVETTKETRANERIRELNTRAKQAEERLSAITPTVTHLAEDPIGFFLRLGEELQAHPEHSADPRLRSQAAKVLGARRAAPQADPSSEMPEITPLVDSNGHQVLSMEDAQKLIDFKVSQAVGELQKTIAPITEERAYAKRIAEATHLVEQVEGNATQLLTEYRKAPGWTDATEPAIKAKFAALCRQGFTPEAALGVAYTQVVAPTLGQSRVQQVVTSLQTKPQATTVATRSMTTPGKPGERSVRDLTKETFAEMGL